MTKFSYKISYKRRWDSKGTCYRQTINVTMGQDALNQFNNRVYSKRLFGDYRMQSLGKGMNYPNLTTSSAFCHMTGIHLDKRYKADVNTAIIVNLI